MSLHHGHSHSHSHGHDLEGRNEHASSSLARALGVTVAFMALEALGGWYANSLALLSDAGHMAIDAFAMGLSYWLHRLSRRPSTRTMSFGYHRAEILGALASGLLIWGMVAGFVFEAFQRLQNPPEVNAPVLIWIALAGLGANLFSMRLLHRSRDTSLNVKAAYLHLLTDSVGSLGAVLAGLVLFFTGWRAIDPVITLISAVLMIISSWDLVRESVEILMESTPRRLDPAEVESALASVATVREVHDLHIWSVSSHRLALSVHLISDGAPESVLSQANELLQERFAIRHTTIQVEHPDRFQSDRCYDCFSEHQA